MRYLYYPGCSLEGTAKEYDISTRAMMQAAGAELTELDDWTCCGASAAPATGFLLSLALPARNLALAEKTGEAEDILVPCSACYLNLKKVELLKEPGLHKKINTVLNEDGLEWKNRVRVRHLLDIIAKDMGRETLESLVKNKLPVVIAPYYGCQCLRPFALFDDPEEPKSMDPVIKAVGATVHNWNMGGKCCGASHMNTKPEVGMELVTAILKAARGADAIVTVCPMCQINLEAYQKKISRNCGEDLSITILYLPQLIGMAMGLPKQDLRLDLNLAVTDSFQDKLKSATR